MWDVRLCEAKTFKLFTDTFFGSKVDTKSLLCALTHEESHDRQNNLEKGGGLTDVKRREANR